MNAFAVLLAGGTGTRLFPLSTPERPKQVLPLLPDGRSPLLATWQRLAPRFDRDRVIVVTGRSMERAVRDCLPEVPDHAFVIEPEPRNTLPALVAAAAEVARRGGDVLLSVHADHRIEPDPAFLEAADDAVSVAVNTGLLCLVGVRPTRPDTGLGWIVATGQTLPGDCWRVERFVEKPPLAEAERLLRQGGLWNLGAFAWSIGAFARDLPPAHRAGFDRLVAGEPLAAVWPTLPRISIDHGVVEGLKELRVVEGRFEWSDLGTFAALGLPEPPGPGGAAPG